MVYIVVVVCLFVYIILVNILHWEEVSKGNLAYPIDETNKLQLSLIHVPFRIVDFNK
jgi:hypothetical protein